MVITIPALIVFIVIFVGVLLYCCLSGVWSDR